MRRGPNRLAAMAISLFEFFCEKCCRWCAFITIHCVGHHWRTNGFHSFFPSSRNCVVHVNLVDYSCMSRFSTVMMEDVIRGGGLKLACVK